MSEKVLVWSRVDANIKQILEEIANTRGISLSEYIRQLILEDLDRRSVLPKGKKIPRD